MDEDAVLNKILDSVVKSNKDSNNRVKCLSLAPNTIGNAFPFFEKPISSRNSAISQLQSLRNVNYFQSENKKRNSIIYDCNATPAPVPGPFDDETTESNPTPLCNETNNANFNPSQQQTTLLRF